MYIFWKLLRVLYFGSRFVFFWVCFTLVVKLLDTLLFPKLLKWCKKDASTHQVHWIRYVVNCVMSCVRVWLRVNQCAAFVLVAFLLCFRLLFKKFLPERFCSKHVPTSPFFPRHSHRTRNLILFGGKEDCTVRVNHLFFFVYFFFKAELQLPKTTQVLKIWNKTN